MLKKFRIQNFKVWEDTGEIDLAPITLFFGANSSGKSSIGQFLMMLKQTVESRSRDVFYLRDKNSAVQLGSYQEMVFQRDIKKDIEFEYQWSSDNTTVTIPSHKEWGSGNDLAFQAKVGCSPITHLPWVELFNYKLMKNGQTQLSFGMERWSDTQLYYKLFYKRKSSDHKIILLESDSPTNVPHHFFGYSRSLKRQYQAAEIFQYKHEELFSTLFYLGPLRSKAERSYLHTGGTPESVGYEGEDTVTAILAARAKDKIYEKNENRFERRIASKLRDIGLIEDFKVEEFSERSYEVKVRTKGSTTWVELPDVGFGISQVLPVLVQCDYAPEGSIILIDQPEIHLHPYAQSELADVMIDVIKKRNIQLIIETHSEHFLRRLQRRIAEDKLSQDKVSAYFADINNLVPLDEVEPKISEERRNLLKDKGILSANDLVRAPLRTLLEMPGIGKARAEDLQERARENVEAKAGAKLARLKIDEFGNIQNWPKNFFGDEMGDVLAQTEAGIQKRMQRATQGSERYK